jgi:hypothetical protein
MVALVLFVVSCGAVPASAPPADGGVLGPPLVEPADSGYEDAGAAADMGAAIDTGSARDAGSARDGGGTGHAWTDVFAIMHTSCVLAGCHDGPGWNLDLSTESIAWQELLVDHEPTEPCGSQIRVSPGRAQDSVLYLKVVGSVCLGTRMPFRLPPLRDEEVAAIAAWIDEGAHRD